jgi:hypothetical protein
MTIGMQHYTHKELQGVRSNDVLLKLQDKGIDVMSLYRSNVLGTCVKKELYLVENAVNPKTGELLKEPLYRTRIKSESMDLRKMQVKDRIDFVIGKYWPKCT